MKAPHYTHNGWMLFCPVKMGGVDTDCPHVAARWLLLEPLLLLATLVQRTVISLCSLADPTYEPSWYFRITGKRR